MTTQGDKLGGLLTTQDYSDWWGTFPCLKAMTDWTCVLDDNSTIPFPFQDQANEYLSLRRGPLWNDTANRVMLLYRAYLEGCHWVISSGGDVLPSRALFDGIRGLIPTNGSNRVIAPFRELWGDIHHYRADGTWKIKTAHVLTENWFFNPQGVVLPPGNDRLHGRIWPLNIPRRPKFLEAPFAVYHFGSMTPELRQQRVEKYREQDPLNQFQGDYKYLANTDGAVLAETPAEDVQFLQQWMRL